MNFTDISTAKAIVIVKIGSLTFTLDNLDPDSDIVGLNDRQTGDGEVTPDGYFNAWGMRAPIEMSVNVTGASVAGRALQDRLNAQAEGEALKCSVVVQLGARVSTYGPGVLVSAKPAPHLGNQKIQPITFNFKFGNVI